MAPGLVARRLDSPLDSVLWLTDAAGKELARNDDFEDKGAGLTTHHADCRISSSPQTAATSTASTWGESELMCGSRVREGAAIPYPRPGESRCGGGDRPGDAGDRLGRDRDPARRR